MNAMYTAIMYALLTAALWMLPKYWSPPRSVAKATMYGRKAGVAVAGALAAYNVWILFQSGQGMNVGVISG